MAVTESAIRQASKSSVPFTVHCIKVLMQIKRGHDAFEMSANNSIWLDRMYDAVTKWGSFTEKQHKVAHNIVKDCADLLVAHATDPETAFQWNVFAQEINDGQPLGEQPVVSDPPKVRAEPVALAVEDDFGEF